MRKLYLFLCLLPAVSVAQVYDDFSDADLLHDPAWSGNLEHFKISYSSAVPEGQRPALQLDAPGAGISGLSTASELAGDLQWQCWIKLSFNSSSGNFARFYLMSDNDNLSGPLSGYFIQTGGADDSVVFCRQDSLAVSRLFALDSLFAGNSTNSFRLKILRNPLGFWQFYADPAGGQGLAPCGEFTDTGISSGSFTGLYCQYTSSNASKFYFDDIYAGPRIVDSIPPALLSAEAINEAEIRLGFSEALDEQTAINRLNYSLSPGSAHPSGAGLLTDPSHVLLSFDPPIQEGLTYTLTISSMKDLAGNESGPLSASLSYYRVKPYDIVFSEIMADPSPPFNLPEFEYLEIHNRSVFPLNIGGWALKISSSNHTLPSCIIGAGHYLIICDSEAAPIMSHLGQSIGLESFNLPNSGAMLHLLDTSGQTICFLDYDVAWFKNNDKAGGGWSLEMSDPGKPCFHEANWSASVSADGGTPGHVNSLPVFTFDEPGITRVCCLSETQLEVEFNQSIDSLFSIDTSLYLTEPLSAHPYRVSATGPAFNTVVLDFNVQFTSSQLYELVVGPGLKNCTGEETGAEIRARFALPRKADSYDIIINEVLFNPWGDGADFIELYNRSSHAIELQDLILASVKSSMVSDPDTQTCSISGNCSTLLPSAYLVLTSDPENIALQYACSDPETFLKMDPFPSYNNEDGFVLLMNNENRTIDAMQYTEDMHFLLLSNADGVSLERISPDRPGDYPDNWHSAAETCDFGTPGQQNSQYLAALPSEDSFSLQPEVFSPDSDGIEDQLGIVYSFGDTGKLMTILIFSADGHLVRTLVNNEMPGTQGVYSWDGTLDDRTPAQNGIYIVYAEVLGMDGKSHRFKKAAVLARRR
jgi:hypothetical protein